ncbi:MAG: acylphosphatase [Parcubacteria group bacterium Gr01-1014_70]|nr:MAG: acylphosphatase [Parcubacteria group bacterium Gr01-1014_70]
MNGIKRITCRITGRVQMVMFRDFAQRKARKLRLAGFVHNEPDGSVMVVAEGTKEQLESYLAYLHKGSILSRVDRVEVSWEGATNKFRDFSIKF